MTTESLILQEARKISEEEEERYNICMNIEIPSDSKSSLKILTELLIISVLVVVSKYGLFQMQHAV